MIKELREEWGDIMARHSAHLSFYFFVEGLRTGMPGINIDNAVHTFINRYGCIDRHITADSLRRYYDLMRKEMDDLKKTKAEKK